MKKNKLVICIVSLCVFTLTLNSSCKKEVSARVIESFTLSLDNAPLPVKSLSTKIRKGAGNKDYLLIVATLSNNDQAFVGISFNEIGVKALLDVSKDHQGDLGYLVQSNHTWYEASVKYPAGSGKIIVTNNELARRTIAGTFSGTLVSTGNVSDKKNIRNGSFIVRY